MSTKPDPIDMSPDAIARRLETVRQLYRLWLSLADVRLIGPVEELRRVKPSDR